MGKLTAIGVKTLTKIGSHLDGDGLYLKVQASKDAGKPNKSWIFRWGAGGAHSMGLGSLSDVTLAQARELAAEARRHYKQGKDPRVERQRARAQAQSSTTHTFAQVATALINDKKPGWKNAKHAEQWTNTLTTYAFPVIGNKACADVTRDDVLAILRPIWETKHATATRLRSRVEAVWNRAEVLGLCEGKNPAQWRGGLEHFLSSINKKQRVKHHSAMPYAQVPKFMKDLVLDPVESAKALSYCVLTATRTGETIGATWGEIDLDNKIWTIPKTRMKKGKEHRVPLSDAAIQILQSLERREKADYIFRGRGKKIAALSNMAMLAYLQGKKEYEKLTVHGFRSSFRDWAGEKTPHEREVIEHALAHQLSDQSEAAYQRGDYLEKRTALMQDWADYCLK